MTNPENPFVGPRSFSKKDRDRFYGRDREARDLLSLVISERLVLFYAQSGAGKSSLVNTRLIPDLVDEGFIVLPTGRVSGELPEGIDEVENIFIFNLLVSLDQSRTDPNRFCDKSLSQFLANLVTTDGEYFYYDDSETSEEEPEEYQEPAHVLILDQFEEILTTHLEHWQKRGDFFRQLDEAMAADPLLWVVLVLREDFVAPLDPYTGLMANRMRPRYYMQRMGFDSALEAVSKPAEKGGRPFAPGVAELLVDNLRMVPVGQGHKGSQEFVAGEFIELVQLQVVCFQLWENLKGEPGDQITLQDLEKLAKGADLAQFINRALGEFYEQALARVVGETGVAERKLRDWFSTRLITESDTRGYVYQGEKTTGGLPNQAVQLLGAQYIIRSEPKAGGIWIELVHDRFIGPIQRANQEWRAAHQNPLVIDAETWLASNRDPRKLYEGEQLKRAQAQIETHPEEQTQIVEEFITASEKAVQQKAARRQRRLLIGATTLLVILGTLTVFALRNAFIAQEQRNSALAQRSTAQAASMRESTERAKAVAAASQEAVQRAAAQTAEANAVNLKITEEAARADAEAQRATAEYNEKQAEKNANFASSRQIAAQAISYLDSQPKLAALLGVEAYRVSDTLEAKSVLLTSLERSLAQTFRPVGREIPVQSTDINSVALSPDGQHLAWGSSDGSLVIWDYSAGEVETRFSENRRSVNGVAFSPDGKRLAAGGSDFQIRIYEKDEGSGKFVGPIATLSNFNVVSSVSFNPDGSKVAASVGIQVTIWDVNQGTILNKLREFHNNDIASVAWSPDGSKIASGGADRRVIVWNPDNAEPILIHRTHQDLVYSVAWSPDSRLLASGSRDGNFLIWDVARGGELRPPVRAHGNNSVFSVSFSRDGSILASGGGDRTIQLTSVLTGDPVARLENYFDFGVRSLAFTPLTSGPNLLVSGSFDNKVGLHEVVVEQPLSTPQEFGKGAILGLASRRDGSIRMVGQDQNLITIWELGRQDPIHPPLAANVVSAALSPDGASLAISDQTEKIQVYAAGNGAGEPSVIQTAFGAASSLAFSPDGGSLASSHCLEHQDNQCVNSLIAIWDPASGQLLSQIEQPENGHTDLILSLAFHPTQPILASGGRDRSIILWDREAKQALGIPLSRHLSSVTSLAFSPSGKLLASGSLDNTIILWDFETKQMIGQPLTGSSRSVSSLIFDREGKFLYSGNQGGDLWRWDVDFSSWVARACNLARRNFFQNEWQQFFRDQPYRKTCDQWPEGP